MKKHFRHTDGLFARYAKLMCDVVIPYQEKAIRDEIPGVEPSGSVANFRNAAAFLKTGVKPENGDHYGCVFQDSDVAKWLEAAAYSLAIKPDAALEARVDELCSLIAAAQEEDGYLDTYFTLGNAEWKFTNLQNAHELYCAGHMIEAAVALYEVTGKDKLLHVVKKNADLLYRHFVTEGAEGYPGHPEIELALMRLWRVTGEMRYRELAEHFINVRGVDPAFFEKERERRDWRIWNTDREYQQSHMPVRAQRDAVGHAVRACYLYTAMADIAAVTGDEELKEACFALFDSIEKRRMYITGGIGSTNHGEKFTTDYDLPNDIAYAETCASIALVFFARKLLQLKRDGRFADVMERAIYNTVLAGIELDGTKFFYVNPLEVIPGVSGRMPAYLHALPQRPGWFGCACCPPNAARLFTSIADYAWECEGGTVYANLYAAGELALSHVRISVETAYPFGDTVKYRVTEGKTKLAIHIPAFTGKNFSVSAPGELRDGYYYLDVSAGDEITLKLDMTPKLNRAKPLVAANSGMGAVTVGPVVYCAEGADNAGSVFDLTLNGGELKRETVSVEAFGGFSAAAYDLGTVYTVAAEATALIPDDPDALYFTEGFHTEPRTVRLIPYFMWGNRGLNQMRVWLPVR